MGRHDPEGMIESLVDDASSLMPLHTVVETFIELAVAADLGRRRD
jgi:hypothetical protein